MKTSNHQACGRSASGAFPISVLVSCMLGACAPGTVVPVVGGFGADIAIFHRSLVDMVYSGITGRDCSIVNLDDDRPYCRIVAPPPPPQPYCTRSLANVDCWADPATLPDHPPQVADGPTTLTALQERKRLAPWPDW